MSDFRDFSFIQNECKDAITVIWQEDKDTIRVTRQEPEPNGTVSSTYMNFYSEDSKHKGELEEQTDLYDFLKMALQDVGNKARYQLGDIVALKKPCYKMDRLKVIQVVGTVLRNKIIPAYIGNLLDKKKELTPFQILCLDKNIKGKINE